MDLRKRTWQVMVVEDEFDSAQVITRVLQYYGIEVHLVNNGQEAIQLLEHFTPTVIIMDLALPEMDGWQTLSHIRSNAITAQIPVVAITAYHSVSVAHDALGAGFNEYLPKPLDPSSLIKKLDQLLNR